MTVPDMVLQLYLMFADDVVGPKSNNELYDQAYSAFDDVPSHVNPIFYDALAEWGYDGFVIADDTGMSILLV